MRNTSTFQPNLLTPEQFAEMQAVFDQVCAEFSFGPDDKDARDRIACTLMSIATTTLTMDGALQAARLTAREIVSDQGRMTSD
jgi:hypothetical protein